MHEVEQNAHRVDPKRQKSALTVNQHVKIPSRFSRTSVKPPSPIILKYFLCDVSGKRCQALGWCLEVDVEERDERARSASHVVRTRMLDRLLLQTKRFAQGLPPRQHQPPTFAGGLDCTWLQCSVFPLGHPPEHTDTAGWVFLDVILYTVTEMSSSKANEGAGVHILSVL